MPPPRRQVVYPFALRRLLSDPRGSPLLRRTLVQLTHDPASGRLEPRRLRRLLRQVAELSGRSRARLVLDAARSTGGRAFVLDVLGAAVGRALRGLRRRLLRR